MLHTYSFICMLLLPEGQTGEACLENNFSMAFEGLMLWLCCFSWKSLAHFPAGFSSLFLGILSTFTICRCRSSNHVFQFWGTGGLSSPTTLLQLMHCRGSWHGFPGRWPGSGLASGWVLQTVPVCVRACRVIRLNGDTTEVLQCCYYNAANQNCVHGEIKIRLCLKKPPDSPSRTFCIHVCLLRIQRLKYVEL